jgi:hypothetical protein
MKRCSCPCQLCSPETRSRVPTKWLLSLVTLNMQSPHLFWRMYILKPNTVIMERNKHRMLRVSISVVWFQKCVHIKSCLARGYIPKACTQVKMTFVPATVKSTILGLRHIVPLVYWLPCRKQCKFGNRNIKDETMGRVPTSVTTSSNHGSPQKLQCTMWLQIYRKE